MLKVLGRPNSFNVRKVLWLCTELGIPYDREDWGRGYTPTSTPEFLKLNPWAQIPVVIDGDLVMRESNAIIRYLAAKHGAEALYPTDLAARFKVEQWMDWVAYDLTHAMRGAFLGGQLQEAPWNNEWFVGQGRRDFTECIALVEAELAKTGGYSAGAGGEPVVQREGVRQAELPRGGGLLRKTDGAAGLPGAWPQWDAVRCCAR